MPRELRALVVGIDDYPLKPLTGSVSDAKRMASVLRQHGTQEPNFAVKLLTAPMKKVTESTLLSAVHRLFDTQCDAALFYFSGHGCVTGEGGFIMTQDWDEEDAGMSMDELLAIANKSTIRDKFIILDCCHSGKFGSRDIGGSEVALLSEGLSVLTSSRDLEDSIEEAGGGLFTSLVVDALEGGASDLQGNVTPGGIYAYVDRSLSSWDQRPIFKANVSRFFALRKNIPPIKIEVLRKIGEYFDDPLEDYQLKPSYEDTSKDKNPDDVTIFKNLQKLVSVGLVVPVGADHMYYAAMNSKSCRLTPLGRHYWRSAIEGKI